MKYLVLFAVLLFFLGAADAQTENLTSNEIAANGPFPGNLSLYAPELSCCQQLETPGYYQSLNGAEVADSERSQLYPCADFLGSWTGPNQVFARKSRDSYQAVSFINNRKPGELYLTGGDNPAPLGPVAPGPFVAKVDASTGAQIWRTYLDNGNVDGVWIGTANLNILPDGNIVVAWNNNLVKLDGDTGLILKHTTLPQGQGTPQTANFKHLTIAPDGTLILKTQVKPAGCPVQGTAALIVCPGAGTPTGQANSEIVAVDPDTLEVLDSITMPEETATPHTITMFRDQIAIYTAANENAYRYFWNPRTKELSQDTTWVVSYLQPGQTTGDAPGILGDWVLIQTNGLPTNASSSTIVAINQDDPTKMTSIAPFGPLPPSGSSWAPPKCAVDTDTNMIYSCDQHMRKNAGIKVDPATGEMTTVWVGNYTTTALQALVGPEDQRVLVTSNINPSATLEQINQGNYTEQCIWQDAATGRLLAASDFFEPMMINTLPTPGFGGRFYFPTDQGFIVFQVMPATNSTATGSL
jgi:outer membrane protein assembly factor BamB